MMGVGLEKLGSEEKRARKELVRNFDVAFKAKAKARQWGYLKPTAFLKTGDWFVSIDPMIWTDARRARIGVAPKPFALDDLVSRIMLHDGLDGTPLSLRARGPHCLVLPMFDESIECDPADPVTMADAAEHFANVSLDRIASLSLDDFVEFTRDHGPPGHVSVNHVASLILTGRNEEALRQCEAAISAKQWGGPARITEDGQKIGFFEFARRWLRDR